MSGYHTLGIDALPFRGSKKTFDLVMRRASAFFHHASTRREAKSILTGWIKNLPTLTVFETATENPMYRDDDASVVSAAQDGDRTAFEILIQRHERRIRYKVQRITRNREDTEDVLQQTFHNAFVHLRNFEGRSSFSTWLMRIALNEALMLKRSGRRYPGVSIDDFDTESTAPLQIVIDANSKRNMLFGPAFRDVDPAISRDISFHRWREGLDLQFRPDAYNAFNIVSLSTPSGNGITAGSSTFGEILTANPMRQLQLGLRLSF
jgi:RNA polymerase sigma factor (sigma-70 family)